MRQATDQAGRGNTPPRFSLETFLTWLRRHPEFGAFAGTVVVFIGFSITATRFLTPDSFAGILTVASELGIVAAGITFLMISGEFDLSVGSVLGVAASLIVTKTGIPSFITTLGAMMFWRGILLAVTKGFPIQFFPKTLPPMFFALNGRFVGQFRTSALWFLGIVLLINLILVRTRYGNAVYATGGNRDAARVLGVATDKVKLVNFVISAVLAGLAGCIQFARFLSILSLIHIPSPRD